VEILTTARKIQADLLALIFPDRCASCDQEGSSFCRDCQQKVEYLVPPLCPLCGYPSLDNLLCHRCQQSPLAIDGIRSVAFFEGPLRRAMHKLKYQGLRTVAVPLGQMMSAYWQREPLPADVIVPVPLHRRRLRQRGYNQAGLLAQVLGQEIGLPVHEDWLVRTKATSSQVDLDAAERKQNVAEAFQCKNREAIVGCRVLLIDDVCTTGATLEACSLALRQAGAQSVWALTLGRAR
jgi:ComF family protein